MPEAPEFIKEMRRRSPGERRRIAILASTILTVLIVIVLFPFLGTPRQAELSDATANVQDVSLFSTIGRTLSEIWQESKGSATIDKFKNFQANFGSIASSSTPLAPSADATATPDQAIPPPQTETTSFATITPLY